jgi:hypothetical protein
MQPVRLPAPWAGYHAACDTFSNNSNEVLDLNSDAIAFATLTDAMDTSSVNGRSAAAA